MRENIRFVEYQGKEYTLPEFGKLIGYSLSSIWRHYLNGLTGDEMIEFKNGPRKNTAKWKSDKNLYEGCDPETIRKLKLGIPL